MKFNELEERFFKNKVAFEEADRDKWVGRGESYFFKNRGRTASEQRDIVSANFERMTPDDVAIFDTLTETVKKMENEVQRISAFCKPGSEEFKKAKIQATAHILKAVETMKQKETVTLYQRISELQKKKNSTLDQLLSLERAKLITSSMSETDITGEIIRLKNGGGYSDDFALALRAKCDGKARESLDNVTAETPAYLSGENFRILKRFRELMNMPLGEYSIKITADGKELVENLSPALWLNDKVEKPEIAVIEI